MLEDGLGKRLRSVREGLGWSQQEAGRRAGVDPNMIYQYEAGHRNPSTLALRGLAALYGKPVEWFFGEKEAESEESKREALARRSFVPDYDALDEETAADLRMLEEESQLALRLGGKGQLTPETIRQIASFIRWVREQEEKPE